MRDLLETIVVGRDVHDLELATWRGNCQLRGLHQDVFGWRRQAAGGGLQFSLDTKKLPLCIAGGDELFGAILVEKHHVAAVQQLRHELAGLEPVKAQGLNAVAKGGGKALLLGRCIQDQVHEIRNMLGKHAEQRAEIDRVPAGRGGVDVDAFRIIIRIVLPDDLNHDANTAGQGVTTAEHVLDELLDAGLRDKLAGELVGADARLLVLRGVGRNGDDCLDEVGGRCLGGPAVLGAEEGHESRHDVLRIKPLRKWSLVGLRLGGVQGCCMHKPRRCPAHSLCAPS